LRSKQRLLYGLRSALCLPLVAPLRGRPSGKAGEDRRRAKVPTRLLGAIYLDSRKEVRPFDAKDRRLRRRLARHARCCLCAGAEFAGAEVSRDHIAVLTHFFI